MTLALAFLLFYLEGLEEVETGLREDHPQLLPAVGRLELAEQVSGEQGAERSVIVTHLGIDQD